MHNPNILIIYQDIDSGAKVVTEEIIAHLQESYPEVGLIIYKQDPLRFSGAMAATKNFLWSLYDCIRVISIHRHHCVAFYTPYYLAAFAGILLKQNHSVVFHFHGDHAITKIDLQPGFFGYIKYAYVWVFGKIIAYLQTTALNTADSVIFVASQAEKQIESKYHLDSLGRHSYIVPNGVSPDSYHPIANQLEKSQVQHIRKRYGLLPNTLVLLYSGRIDQKKGIEKIFEALHLLKKQSPRQKYFLFVVYPNYKDKDSAKYFQYLKKIKKQQKLPVAFISQPKSLRSYYQAADICVLPSEQEMMPLVMLESLACGTVFFGTKVGNMPAVLKKISLHLILTQQTAASIITSLTWWQKMTAIEQRQIKQRCLHLSHTYSWQTTTKKTIAVISQGWD